MWIAPGVPRHTPAEYAGTLDDLGDGVFLAEGHDVHTVDALDSANLLDEIDAELTALGRRIRSSREALHHLSGRIRARFASLRNGGPARRIYVTRDDNPQSRQMERERAARSLLVRRGFEPVTVSSLDPLKIVETFYNAEVVVGAHGAGLLNVVFSDPDVVRLVELDTAPEAWNSIGSFARGLGVDYVKIASAARRRKTSSGAIDLAALEAALDCAGVS